MAAPSVALFPPAGSRGALRSDSARRRLASVQTTPGGFFFLVFFMNVPTQPFFLFMSLSFFNVPHVCGRELPQGFFGKAAIMTSTCFHAQAARRRPAAGSEAPSAGREQRGHANEPRSNCQQFFSEPSPPAAPIILHLQLPPADRSV